MAAEGRAGPGPPAARLVASTLAAAFAIQACGGQPPSSTPSAGRAASASRDGIVITLAIDRDTVETGQELRGRVQVRSVAVDPILWWGGTCRLDSVIAVGSVAIDAPADDGLAWASDAAQLKAELLSGSTVPATPSAMADPTGLADPGDPSTCRADRGFNTLEPGQNLAAQVAWRAVDLLGAPLPPGEYHVGAAFPRVGPEAAIDPALIDRARDLVPLDVEVPLVLTGSRPGLSAGQAVDRVLANPDAVRWLAAHPAPTWQATALRWAGDRWLVEVRTSSGSEARLSVDGRSGSVEVLVLDR